MLITQEHKNILASQSANKTLPEWVEYFNNEYTKNQIYSWCYHNGYSIKKLCAERTKKYHINQDFFKKWTKDMAYIYGYWCSAGYIYNNSIFDITASAKDKYIIKRIADKLGYQGSLQDNVNQQIYRINFDCPIICRDLLALDIQTIPQEYINAYIRGCFDGKGRVRFVKSNARINLEFHSKDKDFLLVLWTILKNNVGVQSGHLHLDDEAYYKLIFGKRDSIKLGKFMYKENPELFLLRKKDKFKDFLNK